MTARAALLGEPHQLTGTLADLADIAGGALQCVGVDRLDGIDDDHVGRERARGGDDGLEARFTEHVHGACVLRETVGPEPQLIGRFFSAGVQHRPSRRLEPSGGLQQQRGLPDAGFSPDQNHRPGHDATAEHEVEFRETGAPPLEWLRGDVAKTGGLGPTDECGAGSPAASACRPPDADRLLRHRIPRTARLAPARPTSDDRGRTPCTGRRTSLWPLLLRLLPGQRDCRTGCIPA